MCVLWPHLDLPSARCRRFPAALPKKSGREPASVRGARIRRPSPFQLLTQKLSRTVGHRHVPWNDLLDVFMEEKRVSQNYKWCAKWWGALTEDYYAATHWTRSCTLAAWYKKKQVVDPYPPSLSLRPINPECDDKGKNTGIRQVAEVWVVIHNNATQMMGISPLHILSASISSSEILGQNITLSICQPFFPVFCGKMGEIFEKWGSWNNIDCSITSPSTGIFMAFGRWTWYSGLSFWSYDESSWLSYDDHYQYHMMIVISSNQKRGDSRLSNMIFWCVILVIWWVSYYHMMIIKWRSSSNRKDPTHAIFPKRLSNMTFQSVILGRWSMFIQQANLLGPVHIFKPYTFLSEFCTVVRCPVAMMKASWCRNHGFRKNL